MPTLAQALQKRPPPPGSHSIVTVVSASPTAVTTSYGVIVNATASAIQAGHKAIVLTIDGASYVIGAFPA
jgi:hypothetical protein